MMSLCHFRMKESDEAARWMSGSDTDGYADKAEGLPFTVVGLHVDLLVSDHSEMASDINRFVSVFALCAGALVKLNIDGYFNHYDYVNCLRAESGPLRVHPSVYLKTKSTCPKANALKIKLDERLNRLD